MRISRRQFLKYCSVAAGALGLSASTILKLEKASADIYGTGPDVIWIAGQACSGCITSLLNTEFFTSAAGLLLDTIDLNFESTVAASPGYWLGATKGQNSALPLSPELIAGSYVLVIEGAIPTGTPSGGGLGDYCRVGEFASLAGSERLTDQVEYLANNAAAVLAVGTCSSFGGIPAARGNSTGATKASKFLTSRGVTTPVVNIPGCPPHPDWIVGTILQYMADPAALVGYLNSDGAPREYFGEYQCNAGPCTWRYQNNAVRTGVADYDPSYPEGNSRTLGANKWKGSAQGCLGILGCKGRKTKADCSGRKWNAAASEEYGVGWCVQSRGGCHGCTHPSFPDGVGKLFTMA